MPLKIENKKPTPNATALNTLRSIAPTAFSPDWNFFLLQFVLSCFVLFIFLFLLLFLLLLTRTRQVDNGSDKTGCDDHHEISRVSFFLSFYSPRLPFAATTSLLQLCTCCVTCIGPIIIELCFALAPSGFPLARRIGHPYQQRTPPKRKKPRTSFTRLQVIFDSPR